ncbi:MAG: hypothetical protein Q8R02_21850 [Hyphomonadaceae bacterium]|nr:hypothetical protein [Hyphomonadaceae bacterium]
MTASSIRACFVASAVAAVTACVQTPGPQANPLSSTSDAIAVALQSGCLPYLVEGGSIYDRLKGHSARQGKIGGKSAALMYGNGSVLIQQDEQGGCYLVATGAFRNTKLTDAAKFRETVLAFIPSVAGPLATRFDSGPGFNDPVGDFRQESYCFELRGKPAWILLSSSTVRPITLQVSVGWDREDLCKGKLPAPQGA